MQQRPGAIAKYRLSGKQNEYIFNGTGGAVIPSMGVAGTNMMSSCKFPIDNKYAGGCLYIKNSRTSLEINESTPNTTHTHIHTIQQQQLQTNKTKNNNTIMTGFGMNIMLIIMVGGPDPVNSDTENGSQEDDRGKLVFLLSFS